MYIWNSAIFFSSSDIKVLISINNVLMLKWMFILLRYIYLRCWPLERYFLSLRKPISQKIYIKVLGDKQGLSANFCPKRTFRLFLFNIWFWKIHVYLTFFIRKEIKSNSLKQLNLTFQVLIDQVAISKILVVHMSNHNLQLLAFVCFHLLKEIQ